MFLDVKITIWERVEFNTEEEMLDVMEKLKNGELDTSADVCDYLDRSTTYIDDTSEQMSREENGDSYTMEIIDENNQTIWTN